MKKHWKITIKYDTIIFHSKLSGGVCLICGDLHKSSPFGCWPLSQPGETINFILVAFNEERSVKMIVLTSKNGVKNLKIALIYVCILKACVRYFLSNFYFFTKWQTLNKYEKSFLFHLKSSFRSQDIFVFLPFLSTFQNQKVKWKWNNLYRELTSINLQI